MERVQIADARLRRLSRLWVGAGCYPEECYMIPLIIGRTSTRHDDIEKSSTFYSTSMPNVWPVATVEPAQQVARRIGHTRVEVRIRDLFDPRGGLEGRAGWHDDGFPALPVD